uniref:Recep_L_domain domain-containing protein n=1 Tax=Heterorhabditis bacteriophora TaxID=37862 RepID=A0A1I7WP67_HETBA
MLSIQFLLRYPILNFGDIFIDNAVVFGGVKLKDKVRNTKIHGFQVHTFNSVDAMDSFGSCYFLYGCLFFKRLNSVRAITMSYLGFGTSTLSKKCGEMPCSL